MGSGGDERWRASVRDGKGMVASGGDAERKRCRGKGWWRAEAMPRNGMVASGASSASERHDCG